METRPWPYNQGNTVDAIYEIYNLLLRRVLGMAVAMNSAPLADAS